MVSRTVAYSEAVAVDDDSEVGCSKTVAEKNEVRFKVHVHVSSDIVMTVILPDGHSAVQEEALVVRYDCVLLIVFRNLQFHQISFVYNSNCPSDVRTLE